MSQNILEPLFSSKKNIMKIYIFTQKSMFDMESGDYFRCPPFPRS